MVKESSKDFDRPLYKKLVRKLKKTIRSISRASTVWGAITKRYKNQRRAPAKEKGIGIAAPDMPPLDARWGKDLMGTFLGDTVPQMLSFAAEEGPER